MRDYDKMDSMEKVQDAIANMLIVYLERYSEYVHMDIENDCDDEAQEDAVHALAYYDYFKGTLRKGTLEELESFDIPFFRMVASGVKVHKVI